MAESAPRICKALGKRKREDDFRREWRDSGARRAVWGNPLRNALDRLVRCLFAEGLLVRDGLVWACDSHQAWLPLRCHARSCISPTCVVHLPEHFKIGGPSKLLDETGARHRIDEPYGLIRQVAAALATSPAGRTGESFCATPVNLSQCVRAWGGGSGTQPRKRLQCRCSHHVSD